MTDISKNFKKYVDTSIQRVVQIFVAEEYTYILRGLIMTELLKH